ncbi:MULTISPECIES: flagellin [Bartonella]|uniref:flagellin N-terminal helical domain-containing protein n=1 Tax=Bartonella TaxID=773 RepID=UPI0018DAFF1D|nr:MULTISPECIES: flagellin [Bartonella]MBH9995002.1 flagellin [Bartonella sp. P0291]MBH9996653.1 flagellin [Bartonella sp. M0192]MBH9998813.1 flagellin [Bartonella sp. M0191]MBI0007804.1 flagellin [Bartonella sp. M0193]MBI0010104.1 flagellin [Bartonella sp. M0176]
MGTSLLTNQSAMNALQTLRSIGDNMDTTQRRVSTGLRINEASDNTAYWSISSMMKSDRNALSSVSDAMALGKSQIDVANATIDKSKDYLDNIQKSLTTAYEKGSGDIKKIQADIKANMNDIQSAVYSASLAEKNILGNNGESVRIAGSYRREGSAVYVDMIDVGGKELNFATKGPNGTFDLSKGVLSDVFGSYDTTTPPPEANKTLSKLLDAIKSAKENLDNSTSTAGAQEEEGGAEGGTSTSTNPLQTAYDDAVKALTDVADKLTVKDFANADFSYVSASGMEKIIKAIQGKVTTATSNVVTAGATIGAAKAQVTGQIDYVSKLMDAVDKGVGSLVDADMNAESARLASLQVQQQLGIQALSIANQNSQNILSLFRQ